MKNSLNPFLTGSYFLLFVLTAVFSGSLHAQQQATAAPALTAAQWQADVLYLGEELPKRHRNAFHRVRREDFEAAVKKLHDSVPSMNEDEIIVGMMKITALVKDGHTNLIPRAFFRSGFFPVRFYQFSDGLFVRQAAPEYAEMIGGRVVRIGKLSAGEALESIGQAVSADNEMGVRETAPLLLAIPEILAGSRIISDKQKLNLVIETGGKQRSFEVRPTATLEMLLQPPAAWVDAAGSAAPPLYRKDPQNLYWFEYLKDRKTVYVQQNAVANKPDEPLADFYKRVFSFVEANPVEKFVLDLRHNGGGNNTLNRALVVGLIRSKINSRGKLFVITGRQTFSAAQNLVNQIEKYTEAIFVGEPTAGHPNHYGDNRPFELPNSKLTVRASSLWWQDVDPRDQREWTAPELAVELSSEDYRSGKDTALEEALAYVPGSGLAEMLETAGSQDGVAEFIAKFKTFKASSKNRFVDTEAAINRFGYALLQKKRTSDAIEIFKLNAESYPRSANVYDSLGDALEAAGRKEEAIKSFEKALSIDPNYPTSLAALRRLKGQ